MRLPGHLRITRPANALVSGAAAYVGALLAGAGPAPSAVVLAAMAAATTFAAAGNVRNDLTDVAIDQTAHPTRPLVTGEVRPRAAHAIAIALYAAALAAGAAVSWIGLVLVVLAIPLMEGYERWAKARGFAGNALIGILTGAPFVLGAIAGGGPTPEALLLAALAALATTAREVLKDVEDVDADRGARRTLPMAIGPVAATRVAIALLAIAVVLSPLPWFLGTLLAPTSLAALAPADALFLAAAATSTRSPPKAQRLTKLGMVAALAAFVVARLAWAG